MVVFGQGEARYKWSWASLETSFAAGLWRVLSLLRTEHIPQAHFSVCPWSSIGAFN